MKLAGLKAPFAPQEIEWRIGSTNADKTQGLALAYITARHVMDRLDAVCSPENWQDRYEFHGARSVCYLSIKIGDEWVTKADGAGDSDVEAEKGAISDALKRAAVKWGIGRYLYDLASPWVPIEAAGKSWRIAPAGYGKLEALLARQFASEGSGQAISGFDAHQAAVELAASLEALKDAFNAAKSDKTLTQAEADLIILAKDKRKTELTFAAGSGFPGDKP